MRYFRKFLSESDLNLNDRLKIAIVGGGLEEHELKIIDELSFEFELYILNVAGERDFFLDLNSRHNNLPNQKFDLILCSQVFEHIWNIQNALNILQNICKTHGYIYLNVPFSNMVHRDEISDFHTPGYSSNFLRRNFENAGMRVIESVDFGTRRLYNSIHLLQVWLYPQELEQPLTFGDQRKYRFKIIRKMLNLPICIQLLLWSNDWIENGQFSTESIIFVQK
jgi:SAM-dependent methyltransferase